MDFSSDISVFVSNFGNSSLPANQIYLNLVGQPSLYDSDTIDNRTTFNIAVPPQVVSLAYSSSQRLYFAFLVANQSAPPESIFSLDFSLSLLGSFIFIIRYYSP